MTETHLELSQVKEGSELTHGTEQFLGGIQFQEQMDPGSQEPFTFMLPTVPQAPFSWQICFLVCFFVFSTHFA